MLTSVQARFSRSADPIWHSRSGPAGLGTLGRHILHLAAEHCDDMHPVARLGGRGTAGIRPNPACHCQAVHPAHGPDDRRSAATGLHSRGKSPRLTSWWSSSS